MSDHDVARTTDEQLTRQSPGPPPSRESSGRRWIVSIFGDITRTGSGPPRPTTSPFALFGDIDLDLRQARIPVGGIVINAIAPFGNIEVLVPDGAEVDVGGFTLFGSKKVAVESSGGGESVAQIRVRGFTLFGSLKVRSS
jgi:Cell wall-active antibiotics response 4TMS YvqF